MKSRSLYFLLGTLALAALFGGNACTGGQLTLPDSPAESGVVKASPVSDNDADPGTQELGCANDALKDEPLCKFVEVKSVGTSNAGGQTQTYSTSSEYDDHGRVILQKYSGGMAGKEFMSRALEYNAEGQLWIESWLADMDMDGKMESKTLATYEYQNGKETLVKTQWYTLNASGNFVQVGDALKTTDYSVANTVKVKVEDSQKNVKIEERFYQADRIEKQRISNYNLNVSNPIKVEETQYTYNAQGKLESENTDYGVVAKVNGVYVFQVESKLEISRSYNAEGLEVAYVKDQLTAFGNLKASSHFALEYDDKARLVSNTEEVDSNGDGSSEATVALKSAYDEFGNRIELNYQVNKAGKTATVESQIEHQRLYKVLGKNEPKVAMN